MAKRRVVVTGLGAVTPIGLNTNEFWDGLISGKNGVAPITHFDASKFDTKFAAEVKNFNSDLYFDKKTQKRLDPFSQYGIAASAQAIEDSEVNLEKLNKEKAGVVFGSGIGGLLTLQTEHWKYFQEHNPAIISPFFVPMMISDLAAGQISIRFGFKGPNYATTSACATASHAISDAFMLIERGSADMMICGGSEASITEMSIGGFNAMRAISTWNDRYFEASRPFDKDRNGFVMGEGSGALILEELNHALSRGAKIYAELAGIGLTADAYHITAPAPGGEGAVRSMKIAIEESGLNIKDVDHINSHGTSTPHNDVNETKAIKTVFGDHAYSIVINSTKSMTGHLLGAAGGIEAIATVLTLKNGIIPPTINLQNPDPECDLNYNPHKATNKEVKVAISNTFGFGGHNASLLFKKFEE